MRIFEVIQQPRRLWQMNGVILLSQIPWESPSSNLFIENLKEVFARFNIKPKISLNEITWEYTTPDSNQILYVGDSIDNFCTRVNGNWSDEGDVGQGNWGDLARKIRWQMWVSAGYGEQRVDYDDWRNANVFRQFRQGGHI